MSMVLRTGGTPVAQQMDHWRDLVARSFVALEARPLTRRSLNGSIAVQHLGALEVARVTASSHQIARTPRLIADSTAEYYKLSLQLSGVCALEQDGRRALLHPGDLTIYDTTRPYHMLFEHDFSMLVAMFPRDMLRVPSDQMAQLTATRLPGRDGVAALVAGFLPRVARELDVLSPTAAARMADNVLDLLTTLFLERSGTDRDDTPPRREAQLVQVKTYIEQNLPDASLTPERIAAAHHMSVRSLHHLFEGQGVTVAGHVRTRRLESCRRDLESPALSHRPVSAVAARWGLVDAGHFSKLFKAAYGVSPTEHRMAALARQSPAALASGH